MVAVFLKGVMSCYPGTGSMAFRLPDESMDATSAFSPRLEDEADVVEIQGETEEAHSTDPLSYRVTWTNPTDSPVLVEYEITPIAGREIVPADVHNLHDPSGR